MVQHAAALTEQTLSQLRPEGRGLELSPYFEPFLSKSDYEILYTDYIGTEEIRAKAAQIPGQQGLEVPAVDFVWTPGRPLIECAPPNIQFDYAVASHVMEHVPNPIGWLNDVLSVIKVGGRLALFLPDRRRTSDYFRQETRYHQLVQWWIEQPSVPTTGQVLDFMSISFEHRHDIEIPWAELDAGETILPPFYTSAVALDTAVLVHNEMHYVDVHCTVWNANTFKAILEKIVAAGLLNVSIGEVASEPSEFMVVLTKLGEPSIRPPGRRMTMRPGPVDTGFTPPPTVVGSGIENAVHQLSILRHDMAFVVQLVGNTSAEMLALQRRQQLGLARRAIRKLRRMLRPRD